MAWGGTKIVEHDSGIATLVNDKQYIIKSLDKLNTKMDKVLEK